MELQLPANMKFMGSHGSRIETSWRLTSRRDGIFFKKKHFLYSAAAIAQAHTTILRCVLNNKNAIIFISRPTRIKKKK